jgi:hypothetical protein
MEIQLTYDLANSFQFMDSQLFLQQGLSGMMESVQTIFMA